MQNNPRRGCHINSLGRKPVDRGDLIISPRREATRSIRNAQSLFMYVATLRGLKMMYGLIHGLTPEAIDVSSAARTIY